MGKLGKRLTAISKIVDPSARYSLEEAAGMISQVAKAKFDESVDIAVRLGVNPRQADQMVRGAVRLPHGVGKEVRVLVFAQGEAAEAARQAGADFVGADDMIERIQKDGWTGFDSAVAVRSMMAKVGRLGRVLGPRGLMPNPKSGTVVGPEKVAEVVREIKGGRVEFRVERAGIVHASVGKASMDAIMLSENIIALLKELVRLKPASAKGTYVRSVTISTTMGPGIRLDAMEMTRLATEKR